MINVTIERSLTLAMVVVLSIHSGSVWAGAIREDIYNTEGESFSKWIDHGSSIGGVGHVRGGTGTFLGLNQEGTHGYVITAAHVVASDAENVHPLPQLDFVIPRNNEGLISDYAAEKVYLPNQWTPNSTEGFNYDIAIVEVARGQSGSLLSPELFVDAISGGAKPLFVDDVVGKEFTTPGMGAVGLSSNVQLFSNLSRPDRYPMGITNTIDIVIGDGNRVEFDFDGPGDEPNPLGSPDPTGDLEGMVMPGDSGSSMLVFDTDETWKIAGVVTSNSGDFGYGTTGGGTRIGAYRGALVRGLEHDYWDALVDQPYLADLDMNSSLDASDWVAFQAGFGSSAFSLTDLNNDGGTNEEDRQLFETYYDAINGDGTFAALLATLTLVGDYNGDRTVDGADLTIWQDTYGQSVPVGTGADGNRNGLIDGGDFLEWQKHFGKQQTPAILTSTVIPEPSSAGLLSVALAIVCGMSTGTTIQRRRAYIR